MGSCMLKSSVVSGGEGRACPGVAAKRRSSDRRTRTTCRQNDSCKAPPDQTALLSAAKQSVGARLARDDVIA